MIQEQNNEWIEDVNSFLRTEIEKRELPKKSLHLMKNISKKNDKVTSYSVCIYEPEFPETKESRDDDLGRNSVVINIKSLNDGFELVLNSYQYSVVGNISGGEVKQSKEEANSIKILASGNVDDLLDYIRINLDYKLKTYRSKASPFGCCSFFEKCSDEKKCVHENKLYSTACYYRHHLSAGEIFYGKNKNV